MSKDSKGHNKSSRDTDEEDDEKQQQQQQQQQEIDAEDDTALNNAIVVGAVAISAIGLVADIFAKRTSKTSSSQDTTNENSQTKSEIPNTETDTAGKTRKRKNEKHRDQSVQHSNKDTVLCNICEESITRGKGRQLPCKHQFHKRCWKNLEPLEGVRTCPECFAIIKSNVMWIKKIWSLFKKSRKQKIPLKMKAELN